MFESQWSVWKLVECLQASRIMFGKPVECLEASWMFWSQLNARKLAIEMSQPRQSDVVKTIKRSKANRMLAYVRTPGLSFPFCLLSTAFIGNDLILRNLSPVSLVNNSLAKCWSEFTKASFLLFGDRRFQRYMFICGVHTKNKSKHADTTVFSPAAVRTIWNIRYMITTEPF